MHVLRQYVDGIEGLRGLVAEAAANTVTQGVLLDINPVWLLAYRLSRTGLRPFFRPFHPEFVWEYAWIAPALLERIVSLETIEGDVIDFKWRDKSGWVQEILYRTAHLGKPLPDY